MGKQENFWRELSDVMLHEEDEADQRLASSADITSADVDMVDIIDASIRSYK